MQWIIIRRERNNDNSHGLVVSSQTSSRDEKTWRVHRLIQREVAFSASAADGMDGGLQRKNRGTWNIQRAGNLGFVLFPKLVDQLIGWWFGGRCVGIFGCL